MLLELRKNKAYNDSNKGTFSAIILLDNTESKNDVQTGAAVIMNDFKKELEEEKTIENLKNMENSPKQNVKGKKESIGKSTEINFT